jgi:glycosyltransferase involved in cell wall biosynthesis
MTTKKFTKVDKACYYPVGNYNPVLTDDPKVIKEFQKNRPKDHRKNIIAYRADLSACWFYRIFMPLTTLVKHDVSFNAHIMGFIEHGQIGAYSLAILQRQFRPEVFEAMKLMKQVGTKVVYEIDDDLLHVPEWSPAYSAYGSKANIELVKKFISNVDAVFVTTEYLKKVYSEYCEHIYVLPNSVPFDTFAPMPGNSTKKVVLWQGSCTHERDIAIMCKSIDRLVDDPDVLVKFWSAGYPGVCTVPYVTFYDFYAMLSQQDAYVGLAPVVAHEFNKSKSNLKFLEYTAQGVATVASNFGPYADTIEDGVTGLLVSENKDWYDKIRYLIDHEDERNKIVANAQTMLKEKFDLNKNYVLWRDAINEVLSR